MIDIIKTAIVFEGEDLMDLERIITDGDKDEAFDFLNNAIYKKIIRAQQGRLKSHLDVGVNSIEAFKKNK